VRTNNLGTELPVPEALAGLGGFSAHGGVFLKASRCNHSCGPNANCTWDIDTFSLALTALRPIRAGEEITITYIKLAMSRAERRGKLRNM